MYSRNNNGRDFKLPEHYGGTFLREDGQLRSDAMRDAVGRPSAIPRSHLDDEVRDILRMPENIKRSPTVLERMTEAKQEAPEEEEKEREACSPSEDTSLIDDGLIIAALMFILLSGRDKDGDEMIILFLILLFIF